MTIRALVASVLLTLDAIFVFHSIFPFDLVSGALTIRTSANMSGRTLVLMNWLFRHHFRNFGFLDEFLIFRRFEFFFEVGNNHGQGHEIQRVETESLRLDLHQFPLNFEISGNVLQLHILRELFRTAEIVRDVLRIIGLVLDQEVLNIVLIGGFDEFPFSDGLLHQLIARFQVFVDDIVQAVVAITANIQLLPNESALRLLFLSNLNVLQNIIIKFPCQIQEIGAFGRRSEQILAHGFIL